MGWKKYIGRGLFQYLIERGIRVIILERDNEVALSIASSGLTKAIRDSSVSLPKDVIQHYHKTFLALQKRAKEAGSAYLHVTYEMMSANYSAFVTM